MVRIPHPETATAAELGQLVAGPVDVWKSRRDGVHHTTRWCNGPNEPVTVELAAITELCVRCRRGAALSRTLQAAALEGALAELGRRDSTLLDDAWNWRIANESAEEVSSPAELEEILQLLQEHEQDWAEREVVGGKERGANIVHDGWYEGGTVAAVKSCTLLTRDGWNLVVHPWDSRELLDGPAHRGSVQLLESDSDTLLETMLALWCDIEEYNTTPFSDVLEKARLLHP